ncbi:hypothetical protein, partial [Enhygromyxa salina]|uniref:hypothetical protein n=1 Tax=Enhygromyxa salina TaxID=215803 RepID=UPI00196A07CF
EVSHLLGKALWIRRGFGPIIVTGNSLVSYGAPVIDDELENVAFRWAPTGASPVTVKASSAVVEVVNLAHALDASTTSDTPTVAWTDDTAATVEGGALVFSNNNVEGTWPWRGGVGCGVLLSALDSSVVTDNVSRMTTNNSYGPVGSEIEWSEPAEPIKSFLTQVVNAAAQMSWVMTHMYVGAASSAQVSGNRIIDGSFDALFSAWVGAALSPANESVSELTDAMVYTANVTTHCPVTTSLGEVVEADNVAIMSSVTNPNCAYSLSVFTPGDVRVMVATGVL